jgi:hypothetical protein
MVATMVVSSDKLIYTIQVTTRRFLSMECGLHLGANTAAVQVAGDDDDAPTRANWLQAILDSARPFARHRNK